MYGLDDSSDSEDEGEDDEGEGDESEEALEEALLKGGRQAQREQDSTAQQLAVKWHA